MKTLIATTTSLAIGDTLLIAARARNADTMH